MLNRIFYWFSVFLYFVVFKWQKYFEKTKKKSTIAELSEGPNEEELSRELLDKDEERLLFQGSTDDSAVFIEIRLTKDWAVANLLFLINGKKFILPGEALRKPRWLSSNQILNVGPLRVELREPFKRWRVSYRGDLRDQDGQIRFVHWQSWWSPLSDQFNIAREVPIELMAKCAAETKDSTLYKKLTHRQDFLQWGMFRSRFIVEKNEPIEFDLRGFRLRANDGLNLERLTTAFMQNGDQTVRVELAVSSCLRSLEFGRKFTGDSFIESLDCSMDDDVEHIALHSLKFGLPPTTNLEFSRLIHKQGSGFAWFVEGHKQVREQTNCPVEFNYKATEMDKKFLVLPFTHRACIDSRLSGGKGSNLARLTGLQHKFSVPRGLVVTVFAFQRHLKENSLLKEFLNSLKSESTHGFEAVEEKARSLFTNTKLSAELVKEVREQLELIFEDRLHSIKFAVRSSAVGEDGADLSSAGQLESYLHVGFEEIGAKVLECWASNFRREIMSYRFENGQQLDVPMAVVVQEMISSGKAGVMFTNDPVRGDPSKLVLNLVDGDGEKLVSGHANPTQLVISKRDMSILERSGDELLTDKECLRLAKVGIYLEHYFEYAQDVEFVYKSGRIQVVQSRNITSLDIESDWELKHEFDSALLSTHILPSTGNVGEVFPRPLQALDCSIMAQNYDRTIRHVFLYLMYRPSNIHKHYSACFLIHRQRVFFELVESLLRNWETVAKDRVPEYNLAGTKLFTEEMIEFGRARYKPKTGVEKLYNLYKLGKMIFLDSWRFNKKRIEVIDEMKLCTVPDDIDGILRAIHAQRDYFVQVLLCHSMVSLFSNMCYVLVSVILRGSPEGDVSPELFSRIAAVYSNNPEEVISADVPILLKKLAYAIKINEKVCKKFEKFSSAKEAVEFLKNEKSECGNLFREFLKKHGHRGLLELSLLGVPWCKDYDQLISTLRLMIEDPNLDTSTKKEVLSLENLINSLDLSNGQMRGLRFFIPHAHRGIIFRELAKSSLVYATFLLRNSFWKLAKQMHEEKLINKPELLFHMTLWEVQQLVQSKNQQFVIRARRRQKIYESQCELNYPLVSIGRPVPLQATLTVDESSDLRLHGTTVCEGRVIGKVRVVKTLAEAKETKPGEILITKCTDIAWSPLFPMLKGLVTEIGGLLSHGAVVAREYSLTCIIAVENATNQFKTGDTVLLDATKGTIERLKSD